MRNYRVEALALDYSLGVRDFVVTLREMWRRDSDRTWVISKRALQCKVSSISRLTQVHRIAPEGGSKTANEL